MQQWQIAQLVLGCLYIPERSAVLRSPLRLGQPVGAPSRRGPHYRDSAGRMVWRLERLRVGRPMWTVGVVNV